MTTEHSHCASLIGARANRPIARWPPSWSLYRSSIAKTRGELTASRRLGVLGIIVLADRALPEPDIVTGDVEIPKLPAELARLGMRMIRCRSCSTRCHPWITATPDPAFRTDIAR